MDNLNAMFTKCFNVERCLEIQPLLKVEEQGQDYDYGGKLQVLNKILRLENSKNKRKYAHVTFDADNQISNKGSNY